MKVIPPGIDASMVQPRDPARWVQESEKKVGRSAAPAPVTHVAVSPAARAAAALSAAGRYPRSGEAAVVEKIVGRGDPNAEFKEQVVGLLVDMMGRTRQQQDRARAREAAAREQQHEQAENARRAEAAVGAPAVAAAPATHDSAVAPRDRGERALASGDEPAAAPPAEPSAMPGASAADAAPGAAASPPPADDPAQS